ncbi:MAG: SusC/RagA family TonB-linked outer membrane protein, partial [Bacteroidetes bacterium QH_2_63_10]
MQLRAQIPDVSCPLVSAWGLVAALILLFGAGSASAQERTVKGTVVEAETGQPLPGVNILVVGADRGTTTNAKGRFEITVPSEDAKFRFSFVGFQTQVVSVQGRTELTVEMRQTAQQMEDLVVTALGVERQSRTIGYSVQEVSGADVEETAGVNVLNSLQGKLSGVRIQQSGTGTGGSTRIVIRGNRNIGSTNQPLFVVDGIPIQGRGTQRTGAFGGIDLGHV